MEYLNKIGSMNYTYEKVNSLKTEINDIIDDLGGHDSLKTLVATLHETIPTPQTVSTIDK